MVGVNSSNNSGPENNPQKPDLLLNIRIPKEDDLIPNTQFARHFPKSLDINFYNSIKQSKVQVRQGLDHLHYLMDEAITIGASLSLFSDDSKVLIDSITALSGSTKEFFTNFPRSLSDHISTIKDNGIHSLVEQTPTENVLLALVCQFAYQINSPVTQGDPRSAISGTANLEEFLIKAQIIYNGVVDAKIKEYKFEAFKVESEIDHYHEYIDKIATSGDPKKNSKISKLENELKKLNHQVDRLDEERHDLEEQRLKLFSTEDKELRARILADKIGGLLKTRTIVAIAEKFGLINETHALSIQSIWNLDDRERESQSLGNRLRTLDQRLSILFPIPGETIGLEQNPIKDSRPVSISQDERNNIVAARIAYERDLWRLGSYTKIYKQLYHDIAMKEFHAIGQAFSQEIPLQKTAI